MAAEPLGELAHREILAPGEIDCSLPAALRSIAFGNLRQRTVGVELRCVVAERDRERADGVGIVYEAVEFGALRARLLDCVADHDKAPRQDFNIVPRPSGFLGPAFYIGIEGTRHRDTGLRREHRLRGLGRELASSL